MPVHPTALVDPRAHVDPGADIGPFAVIDGPVRIGAGTRVAAYVRISGDTVIGRDNAIHAGAVIGEEPQVIGLAAGDTALRIGDRNVIREHGEIHRASKVGTATTIGDDNFLMSGVHVAHDCRIGNRVVMATGAVLGGHVELGDQTFLSGNCVVHQFVRVGRLALLRGLARTSRDVPPFCIMDGTHTVRGLNRVGLRRAGFQAAQIRSLQRAFARLFVRRRNLRQALAEVEAEAPSPEVRELVDFIRAAERGVCLGPPRAGAGTPPEDS
jgi:UDP-N-acetylglucosamine acyltransferase